MTRRRCLDCHDGRHCRHTGYVPAGTILAACRCLDCNPQPIQARPFSHVLVDADLGDYADCGQPACELLIGGAGQLNTSLCEACEYRRSLAVTGGPRHASAERPLGSDAASARLRAAAYGSHRWLDLGSRVCAGGQQIPHGSSPR